MTALAIVTSKQSEGDLAWVQLPRVSLTRQPPISLQYGAGRIAADYCGLHSVPSTFRGCWQHGWHPGWLKLTPDLVATESLRRGSRGPIFVAREDEENYLTEHGFMVRAIGLPITYLSDSELPRLPDSLLLMPAHSTRHVQSSNSPYSDLYFDYIVSIIGNFETVVACLHRQCLEHGVWAEGMKRLGIPVVQGADTCDLNTYARVRSLLMQFEYMSTNSLGSHVMYGLAFGARVSIAGPYYEGNVKTGEDEPFYRDRPDLYARLVELRSMSNVARYYPQLFCDPREAGTDVVLGRKELGFENRVTPPELKRLLGLGLVTRSCRSIQRSGVRMAKSILPAGFFMVTKRLLQKRSGRRR